MHAGTLLGGLVYDLGNSCVALVGTVPMGNTLILGSKVACSGDLPGGHWVMGGHAQSELGQMPPLALPYWTAGSLACTSGCGQGPEGQLDQVWNWCLCPDPAPSHTSNAQKE